MAKSRLRGSRGEREHARGGGRQDETRELETRRDNKTQMKRREEKREIRREEKRRLYD
jgi:hypothetical protein